MAPAHAMTRLPATGSPEDLEILRRAATTLGAGQLLSLLAELLSQEADYCLLSGEPAKAAAPARRATILAQAARTVVD